MGQGEKQGAYLPDFDDHGFRTVQVPGEVQLQIGLHGMDLYYQSKSLSLINEKEWWYRKQFFVGESEAGRLLRLKFDGVDYFASVRLNGRSLAITKAVTCRFRTTSLARFASGNRTCWP